MIPLQKIPLHKNYLCLLFFVAILFLTFLLNILNKINFLFSLLAILLTVALYFVFTTIVKIENQRYKARDEELQEDLNILEQELKKKNIILKELPSKAKRIFSIKDITQKFIDAVEPEDVCKSIVESVKSIFPDSDNILLFLFQRDKDSLMLENSIRKKKEIIREKKGDILDWWVLKNNQCLLIEDLRSDYRFDPTNIVALKQRSAYSFVSSPLSIGSRVLGLVRIESKRPNAFSLEDSRLLRAVCDLGVVVLERANLFKRIRELAIKDSLTNLFLRNYFIERFEEEIKRASLKNTYFGIVILDVDDFKRINDTYGHMVGDMVLKRLSSILVKNVGDSGNIICRLGGEEFIFLSCW